MSQEPILYSLASFHELMLSAFDIAGVRRIVEIGAEYGRSTEGLCAYAERKGGQLVTIDPCLTPQSAAFVGAQRDNPHFRFILGTSLEALPGLADADAFVIDGDHNYYTVRHELEAIARHRGGAPWLVFEHDVCWPCGRRDWYFAPERIPAEFVHPYADTGGMTLDGPELVPGGWGDGQGWRIARHEGGPRNGVRTGIEDFLADHPELCFDVIPVIFGLGVIYSRHAPWSSRLADLVRPLADNPLLERVERNRIELALYRVRQPAESVPLPAPEFPPGRNRIEVYRAPDHAAFDLLWSKHLAASIDAQSALCTPGADAFTLKGYCAACGGTRDLKTDFMFAGADAAGRPRPAWRERQVCECRLNCRHRSCFHLLTESLGLGAGAHVYCTEQVTSLFAQIRRVFPHAIGSEYLGPACEPGSVNAHGVRHEDITRLTFADATFDGIVSLDVLEHVPDYRAGLREMARCLKPGGTLLLTAPFCFDQDTTVVRAVVNGDGSITHRLPPVYHGDPVDPRGVLCFNDFGWDLLEDLRSAGFGDATLVVFTAPAFGYVGLQYIFLATRCPATTEVRGRFAWPRAATAAPRRAPAPAAPSGLTDSTDVLRDRAAALHRAEQWDRADPVLCELAKRHPDEVATWLGRVRGHEARGRHLLAGLVREAALDRHPEWADQFGGGAEGR